MSPKAFRLKVLMRQACFDGLCPASTSRPSPSGGLRLALTRLHGKTENTGLVRHRVSSSTQSDVGPQFLMQSASQL